MILLLDAAGWTWIVSITALVIGGYFFFDRLMRKGIYEGRAGGGILGRMGTLRQSCKRWLIPRTAMSSKNVTANAQSMMTRETIPSRTPKSLSFNAGMGIH